MKRRDENSAFRISKIWRHIRDYKKHVFGHGNGHGIGRTAGRTQ